MKLQDLLDNKNKHDMLIVTGDMNTKVGEERSGYSRLMKKKFCDVNKLIITGTLCPHKDIHKAT